MRQRTCDICCEPVGKVCIDVSIEGTRYQNFDLCEVCALPIVRFLKQQKLVTEPTVRPSLAE